MCPKSRIRVSTSVGIVVTALFGRCSICFENNVTPEGRLLYRSRYDTLSEGTCRNLCVHSSGD